MTGDWWADGAMVNVGESGDEGFVGDAATDDDAQRIVDAHNATLDAVRSTAPATGPGLDALRDAQDRAERHSIAQFLGAAPDMLARIDALPIPETDWRSIAEIGAAQLADLVAAVEIMDQKIVPLSERGDGTISQYAIGDSTWHRVLAVARGNVSDKARLAINAVHLAALRAATEARSGVDDVGERLDVERLAEALHVVENHIFDNSTGLHLQGQTHPIGDRQREQARQVAAEYAALATTQPDP